MSLPIIHLASIIFVIVVISFFASYWHSFIVLTLCPTSNPKSHKKVRKCSNCFLCLFFLRGCIRIIKSISEPSNNSDRPYPPTATKHNSSLSKKIFHAEVINWSTNHVCFLTRSSIFLPGMKHSVR